MENLKKQLNETKAQIKELEERLSQLTRAQESLEEEIAEANIYEDEEKMKVMSWFYNPDTTADYPAPSLRDIDPISEWDKFDQYMGIISENLDLDALTDYDIAFLFGHYMANHLLYDREWPEEEEASFSKEYDTYFQMAVTLLFGIKIILENIVKEKGVLEGFQESLDKGVKENFDLLASKDTTKLLSTMVTVKSPYTFTLELESSLPKSGNQNSEGSLETKKPVSSLEELVKEVLNI